MNDRIINYFKKLKDEKKKRKQTAAFITAMSLVVSGTVSWQLHGIGTAMNKGKHTEKADVSTEQLSDASPLCENPQIWENELPDISGADLRESVALIAESQIGYKENTDNFILGEDGESLKYYTRYGDWYGNPYGEWNTMFTYFCMKYGGADENDIPFGSGCWAWSADLQKEELLITMDSGPPQRGDVLFFDSDSDGKADRSGIISELANEGESQIIKVIEGNVCGTVAVQEYPIDDEHIIGYLALENEADNEAESATGPTEQTEEETPPPTVMEFSGISESGIEVTASADVGAFPDGAVMTVSDIDREEVLKAAKDSLNAEMIDAVAVDISFSDKDGNEIEPYADTTVQVQIILPDELKLHDGEFSLLHIADSGDVQKVENAEVSETGAEFAAEEFSIYVVTSNGNVDKDEIIKVNGQAVPNSAEKPYIVAVGEKFELYSESTVNQGTHGSQWFSKEGSNEVLNRQYITQLGNIDRDGQTYRISRAEYTALKPGEATIAVVKDNSLANEYFYVKVIDKPQQYYVYRLHARYDANNNNQRIADHDIYPADAIMYNDQLFPNSLENPYIVYVGEEFDVFLSGNGSFQLPNNEVGSKKLDAVSTVSNASITYNNQTITGTRRTFKALNPGYVYCNANNDNKQFYIKVVDPGADADDEPSIFVKSSFEDKEINKVKEYLQGFGLPVKTYGTHSYVPNGVGKIANRKYNGEWDKDIGRPYAIRVGDTFEIFANNGGSFSLTNYDVYCGSQNDWTYDLKETSSDKLSSLTPDGTYPSGTAAAKFMGVEPGEVEITYKDKDGNIRTMWVRVLPAEEYFNHADMEIADGGKYTVSSTSYVNGQKVTTLKVYDAFVGRVNSAKLLGSDGEPLALDAGNNKIEYMFTSDGPVDGNLIGDYRKIGNQGETQYELSSAYGRNKSYKIKDVDTVVFDVNITMIPEKQIQIIDGVPGTWTDFTGDNKVVENVIWTFDRQGIDDAINKCPMTNGLDFTLRANAALVDLKAVKKLNGGTLQPEQFEFQLYDENNQPIGAPVKNDADGNIVFLDQKFEEEGVFTYTIREVVPSDGTQNELIYADDAEITIKVTPINVPDKNGGVITTLKAEMLGQPPELINYVTYELPATGGTGVIPYAVTGITIIAGAAMLLIRSRRREEN